MTFHFVQLSPASIGIEIFSFRIVNNWLYLGKGDIVTRCPLASCAGNEEVVVAGPSTGSCTSLGGMYADEQRVYFSYGACGFG